MEGGLGITYITYWVIKKISNLVLSFQFQSFRSFLPQSNQTQRQQILIPTLLCTSTKDIEMSIRVADSYTVFTLYHYSLYLLYMEYLTCFPQEPYKEGTDGVESGPPQNVPLWHIIFN